MDTLQNNSIQKTKNNHKRFISNYDIQRLFIINADSIDLFWQHELFCQMQVMAISRLKKNKKILITEDLTQNIFLELWIAIKTFDPYKNFDFYRWSSWHISRGIRKYYNFKKVKNSINLSEDFTISQPANQDDLVDILKAQKIVNKFPERSKQIFIDYTVYEKTLQEIALEKSLSPEGVRKIYLNCQKQIQREIK